MPDTGAPWNIPYVAGTDLVSDWPADSLALANAIDAGLSAGYKLAGTRYYTSSGTFDKADPLGTGDIGLRAIRVRVQGGGGGGGGAGTTGASENAIGLGGGGGAYGESFITDIAGLDATVTVTRGSGGNGGAAGANSGSAGGTSSFGTLVSASGGSGGAGMAGLALNNFATPGAGGSSITADLGIPGGRAAFMFAFNVSFSNGQVSGSSHLGNGVSLGFINSGSDGPAGQNYGGGGGGGINVQNQATARAGGAGGNGIVIVDCYV